MGMRLADDVIAKGHHDVFFSCCASSHLNFDNLIFRP